MKRIFLLGFAFLALVAQLNAQAFTVTPSASTYSTSGGQMSFVVSITPPANATSLSFSAKPPLASWVFNSTSGTSVPSVTPRPGDTIDTTSSTTGAFGWAYINIPSSGTTFTFALSYPAGLSGTQVIALSGSYRVGGTETIVTIPSLSLTQSAGPIAPTITTHPGNTNVSEGGTVSIGVAVSASPAPTMQWQRSTDGGANYTNLANDATFSGTTTSTLTITAATLAMTGQRFRAVATNAGGTITSNGATLSVVQTPVIVTQPVNQTVVAGGTATFGVAVTGTGPLTYQWNFIPSGGASQAVAGGTSATLTIANVQAAQVGGYMCVVTNPNGDVNSNVAQLAIVPRLVQVVSQTAAPDAEIAVPIQLLAAGGENTVSFTLNWNPSLLTYVSSALGADVPAEGSTLQRNVTQTGSGVFTALIGREAGTSFTAGTKAILTVTFRVSASAANAAIAGLTFSDTPTLRKIVASSSEVLTGAFVDGSVTVISGLEGDVNGDGIVDAVDWVRLGRIVVGLDAAPSAGTSSFRKSDAAPRAARGDGTIDAADWVQVGRYVVGLDANQPAGGP